MRSCIPGSRNSILFNSCVYDRHFIQNHNFRAARVKLLRAAGGAGEFSLPGILFGLEGFNGKGDADIGWRRGQRRPRARRAIRAAE